MENLWHYFRSHYWSNRTYWDYEHLREAAVEDWGQAALDGNLVKSVCRAKYAERNV